MSLLRTLFLGLLALLLLLALAWLVWMSLEGASPQAASVDLSRLLPPDRTFVTSIQVPAAGEQDTPEWLVLYRRKDDTRCIYGCLYRAEPVPATAPQTLIPQQLVTANGTAVCLGEKQCTVEVQDVLKNRGSARDLLVWGYSGDLRTRLNLFYWDGTRYVHGHSFAGDRGVLLEGATNVIVQQTIKVGTELFPRNTLCQRDVYEQQPGGTYRDNPDRSTVAFRNGRLPERYPTEPDEVVVAFCLQYPETSARQRYLAPGVEVSFTRPGGFGCMGSANQVEVLRFTSPLSVVGNWATVQTELRIDGQLQQNTTWSLHYTAPAAGNTDQWRWQIVSCTVLPP